MQNAYNYKGYSNDRNLIMAPVNYRVNACGFGGEDGTGITGAPVEAESGCYSSGCGQTAYTPKPNRMGNMVTISSIARPEALLMHRPMSMPIIQVPLITR